jgi:hypothetical protein
MHALFAKSFNSTPVIWSYGIKTQGKIIKLRIAGQILASQERKGIFLP